MRPVEFLDAVREVNDEIGNVWADQVMPAMVVGSCILCAGFLIADAIDKLTASERGA